MSVCFPLVFVSSLSCLCVCLFSTCLCVFFVLSLCLSVFHLSLCLLCLVSVSVCFPLVFVSSLSCLCVCLFSTCLCVFFVLSLCLLFSTCLCVFFVLSLCLLCHSLFFRLSPSFCMCRQQVVVLKNRIHHCRTSGIFMRLAASGLIAGMGLFVCPSACLCVCPSVHPSAI